jgi:hypothetical protein
LTVQAAMDTDSNGATAGSVIGVLLGADAIPEQFMAPRGALDRGPGAPHSPAQAVGWDVRRRREVALGLQKTTQHAARVSMPLGR